MLYFSNTPPAPPSRISRGGGDSLRNCPRIILSSLNGIQVFVFRDFVDFLLACKSPFLSFFLSFFLFPPPKEKFLLETELDHLPLCPFRCSSSRRQCFLIPPFFLFFGNRKLCRRYKTRDKISRTAKFINYSE